MHTFSHVHGALTKAICRRGERNIANGYPSVTVLFVYILDYTDAGLHFPLTDIIAWVDNVFCQCDRLLSENFNGRVFKVEAFQNFYLAIAGCPEVNKRHAVDAIKAGYMMMTDSATLPRPDGSPTRVRVGACSGEVFAGVVGMDSPRFRIFGYVVCPLTVCRATFEGVRIFGIACPGLLPSSLCPLVQWYPLPLTYPAFICLLQ